MRLAAGALLPLLLGYGVCASANEVREVSVAVIRGKAHPKGGLWVGTADAKRRVLSGPLALAVAETEETFTVGATQAGRILHATYVRATLSESVWLRNHRKRLQPNQAVKVIGFRKVQTGGSNYQRKFKILHQRKTAWLDDFQLRFKPRDAPLEYMRISGRIDVAAGQPRITTRVGRLEVVGSTQALLIENQGRLVSGFGLVFRQARKILLSHVVGTTTEQTVFAREASATSESMPLGQRAAVLVRGKSPDRSFLRVEFTWPGTTSTQAFVPADKVVIGQEWREVTGTIRRTPNGRWTVGMQPLALGGVGQLPESLFRKHLGKTLTVAGVLERGELRAKTVSGLLPYGTAATKYRPELPANAPVDVVADTDLGLWVVSQSDGLLRFVDPSAVRLTPRSGAAAVLKKLP